MSRHRRCSSTGWAVVTSRSVASCKGDRFVVGEAGEGDIAGAGGVLDGFGAFAAGGGLREVVRQPRQPVVDVGAGVLFDRLGDALMRPDPAGSGEFVVERGTHERVGEAEPHGSLSNTSRAATASSSAVSTVSSSRPAASRKTSNSNSGPMTAAVSRTRMVAADSRLRRRPTTSRTPSGTPAASIGAATRQPSSPTRTIPVSTRWRTTSRTKNGLPLVSPCNVCASSRPSSPSGWPAPASRNSATSVSVRPSSASRSITGPRCRSASSSPRG